MGDYYIGVDLGGTKILTAAADNRGNILTRKKLPTEAASGSDKVIENILSSINDVIESADIKKENIKRIGVGCPGPLDTDTGIVSMAPNLKWDNVPIVKILEEKLGLSVVLENDANAAALGEKIFGAGKNVDNLIYVTVSTGIGGGIIIGSKIYHGANDGAGEVGHMVIEPEDGPLCGCGNKGCLEALASGTAISRMGKEVVINNKSEILVELCDGNPGKVNGKLIAEAALQGDTACRDIYKKAGKYLGIGLANLINLFNPEMIVLGGGVMKSEDLFKDVMMEAVRENSFTSSLDAVQIKNVELGDDTGVKGAIAVAMEA